MATQAILQLAARDNAQVVQVVDEPIRKPDAAPERRFIYTQEDPRKGYRPPPSATPNTHKPTKAMKKAAKKARRTP